MAKRLTSVRSVICASPTYFDENGLSMPAGSANSVHTTLCSIVIHLRAPSGFGHQGSMSVVVKAITEVNNSASITVRPWRGLGSLGFPILSPNAPIQSGQLLPLLPNYLMPEECLCIVSERDQCHSNYDCLSISLQLRSMIVKSLLS
ncbi:hypothetical protein O9993_09270 [Vibrio lentus]|nr:hypothetical protein [Vibrio lentus]